MIYQREYSGLQTPALRAGFVGFQLDLNDALGLSLPRVRRGATLPVRPSKFEVLRTTAHHGELFVVGDCEGLFISSGRSWEPVEHRSRGEEKWTVRFGPPRPGVRFPLWSAGTGPLHVIWAHWMDARHVRIEYQWTAYAGFATGGTMRVEPGREYHFHVVLDRRGGGLDISREGFSCGNSRRHSPPRADPIWGVSPILLWAQPSSTEPFDVRLSRRCATG